MAEERLAGGRPVFAPRSALAATPCGRGRLHGLAGELATDSPGRARPRSTSRYHSAGVRSRSEALELEWRRHGLARKGAPSREAFDRPPVPYAPRTHLVGAQHHGLAMGLRGLIRYVADWTGLAGLGVSEQRPRRWWTATSESTVHPHESPTGPSIEEELR